MSTLTAPDPTPAPGAGSSPIPAAPIGSPYGRDGIGPAVGHVLTLAARTVTKIRRTPEQLVDATLQPILFVILFVYLFGGALAGSRHEYLQFVIPSIMAQTILFASMTIGVNLNTDIKKGVFDRFRSLPISRSAPLVGAVVGEMVRFVVAAGFVIGFGYVIGFRVQTNAFEAFAAVVLVLVFALCICWVSVFIGMLVREPGAVQGFGFLLMFPLTFGSTTFVKAATLPRWLQAWVQVNPVTHLVDASRGLMLGGPVAWPVVQTLLWSMGILAAFAPLAIRAYRRKS
jgi:oleandomycin transport system permease protein